MPQKVIPNVNSAFTTHTPAENFVKEKTMTTTGYIAAASHTKGLRKMLSGEEQVRL